MTERPAAAVKARIRSDIRAAMTAKNMVEAKVLRTLLAALDNAEAVPTAKSGIHEGERRFGDPAVEVARKDLTVDEVGAVIEAERDERLAAADELLRHGRTAESDALKAEAAVVARYLAR